MFARHHTLSMVKIKYANHRNIMFITGHLAVVLEIWQYTDVTYFSRLLYNLPLWSPLQQQDTYSFLDYLSTSYLSTYTGVSGVLLLIPTPAQFFKFHVFWHHYRRFYIVNHYSIIPVLVLLPWMNPIWYGCIYKRCGVAVQKSKIFYIALAMRKQRKDFRMPIRI